MCLERILSLGFRECQGSSLDEEQVEAIETGLVVIKEKSGNHIKIFLMIDGKRFSKICEKKERQTYLRKLNHPIVYTKEPIIETEKVSA